MKFNYLLYLMILSGGLKAQSHRQEVITPAGTQSAAGNIRVEWTIGDLIIETATNSNSIVTQGYHQSNLIITSIKEEKIVNVLIYPNPTSDQVSIRMESAEQLKLSLTDVLGKVLYEKEISGTAEATMGMHTLAAGIYFLNIYRNDQIINQYKIQKVN